METEEQKEGKRNQKEILAKNHEEVLSEMEKFVCDPEIINNPEKKEKVLKKIELMFSSFSGPLPPPEILKKYGDLIPNAPERILKMAENQSSHRMDIEKTLVKGNSRRENRGLFFAFILGMTTIILGFVLSMYDKGAAGITTMLAPLAILTGSFIYRKYEKSQKSESKGNDK